MPQVYSITFNLDVEVVDLDQLLSVTEPATQTASGDLVYPTEAVRAGNVLARLMIDAVDVLPTAAGIRAG